MSAPLVEVTRGGFVESRHYGSVAVTNSRGELLASLGDPNFVTFIRSSCKPFQAMNAIFSGAAERYAFTKEEFAILCSSHYGEDDHRAVVDGILQKIGLPRTALLCGKPLSISAPYCARQLRENIELLETNSDCSGKHSGFLAVCRHKGYPIENYNAPDHPMQRELLAILSHMFCLPEEEILVAVDGCGVPVHGMPLASMARAYARLTTPDVLDEPYRSAAETLVDAMVSHPHLIAGTGGFCTELMTHTKGRLCGKIGAEAVYCIGVRGKDLGIAVKVEDGNFRALHPAVMEVLRQLDLVTEEELQLLSRFAAPTIKNDLGAVVGTIRPCFTLARA